MFFVDAVRVLMFVMKSGTDFLLSSMIIRLKLNTSI